MTISFEGSSYVLVDGTSWSNARSNAQKIGGDLVVINTKEEMEFLRRNFSSDEFITKSTWSNSGSNPKAFGQWIGLRANGSARVKDSWQWLDGGIYLLDEFEKTQFSNPDYPYDFGRRSGAVVWNYLSAGLPNADGYFLGFKDEYEYEMRGIAEIPLASNPINSLSISKTSTSTPTLTTTSTTTTPVPATINNQLAIDSTKPSIVDAIGNEKSIKVTFDRELAAEYSPKIDMWTIRDNEKIKKIDSINIDNVNGVVEISLLESLDAGTTVTLSYRDLAGDQNGGIIESKYGVDLDTVDKLKVDNQTVSGTIPFNVNAPNKPSTNSQPVIPPTTTPPSQTTQCQNPFSFTTGTPGNDRLKAKKVKNFIYGLAGNDKLFGSPFEDYLDGGIGNDKLRGGKGADTYVVSSGSDKILSFNPREDDVIEISTSKYRLESTRRHVNIIHDDGTTKVMRAKLSDVKDAIERTTTLNSTIIASDGGDELVGHDGEDQYLVGGKGNDKLEGKSGADTFRISNGKDEIVDFTPSEGDLIWIDKSIDFCLVSAGENVNITHDEGTTTINNAKATEVIDGIKII